MVYNTPSLCLEILGYITYTIPFYKAFLRAVCRITAAFELYLLHRISQRTYRSGNIETLFVITYLIVFTTFITVDLLI